MNAKNDRPSGAEQRESAALGPAKTTVPIFIVIALVVLLVLFVVIQSRILPSSTQRNVILIVADAMRADRLGCYGFGRPTSPNIDRLAAGGMRFTDAGTVVPSTLASFATLFTSNYPKEHGAFRNGFPVFESFPTLAESFRDADYETAAFVSSFCLVSAFGADRGFDHYDEEMKDSTILPDNKLVRSAGDVTEAFLRWHDNRRSDRPFFAMVHYFDPHFPYRPPERFASAFVRSGRATPEGTMQEIVKAAGDLFKGGGMPNELALGLHDLYCAEIAYMDEQIGRIVELFREEGADGGETLIIFTADHGETFWEHAEYFSHGHTVYQTAVNVPLIFNCPGLVPAGTSCDEPVSNIDLGPTLLNLGGIEVPREFTGVPFDARVTGRAADDGGVPLRLLFAEGTKPYQVEKDAPRPNFFKAKSVRRGPWKYIAVPYMERSELYNVADDPGEMRDLAGREEHAAIEAALRREVRRWAEDFDRNVERDRTLDPEVQRKLQELGY